MSPCSTERSNSYSFFLSLYLKGVNSIEMKLDFDERNRRSSKEFTFEPMKSFFLLFVSQSLGNGAESANEEREFFIYIKEKKKNNLHDELVSYVTSITDETRHLENNENNRQPEKGLFARWDTSEAREKFVWSAEQRRCCTNEWH